MASRFLSTRNDFKIFLVYGILVLILLFSVEFLFLKDPASGGSGGGGTGGPPGGGEGPEVLREEITCLSASSTTTEGQTSTEGFDIDADFAYVISITLGWSDDVGSNDRFGVELLRDGEVLGSGQGSTGSITFEVADEAEGNLTGEFTVSITAEECPGLVGSHALDRDNGNSWDLRVTAEVGIISQEGLR